jgi:choice-of-anchor B domain-containing protein
MLKLRFLAIGCTAAALILASAAPSGAHNLPILEPSGFDRYEQAFMTTLTPSSRLKAGATTAVNCINGMAGIYPCKDVDLMAHLDNNTLGGGTGSDIEGWTDPVPDAMGVNHEYAIHGHSNGTTFIDVTTPEAPLVVGTLAPAVPGLLWREIEVYNNHAYIVQDILGAGIQIFDLTRLRAATPGVVFTEDGRYTGFGPSHTITINADTGFAYANGSDTCNDGGPHVFDLKPNPEAPVFVGCVSSDGYTHDSQCVLYHGPDTAYTGREICAMYNEDTLTIYDVTDKAVPTFGVMLSRNCYSVAPATAQYTHQGAFTEDHRYILLDDEFDEDGSAAVFTTTYLWDMSDLDDPTSMPALPNGDCPASYSNNDAVGPRLIKPWRHATKCTDHNQFMVGRFSYQSNYACGLRIMDVTNVAAGKLSQAAYFDTSPAHDFIAGASDGGDLDGDWANYPYFRSGIVVSGNISKGLFVLKPHLPSATGPFAVCEDLNPQPVFCEDLESAPAAGWTMPHSFDCDDMQVPPNPIPCVGMLNQPLPGHCATDEWHVTTSESHSATHAWTNNPYTQAFQADHCRNDLTTPPITIPTGMTGLTASFWEHHHTEGQDQRYGNPCNPPDNEPVPYCDFGEVQLCVEPGCDLPSATWSTLSNRYEGGLPGDSYVEKSHLLGPQAGKTIRLRFRFTADSFAASPPQGPFLGWFIDDIVVSGLSAPTAVTVASFTATAARGKGVEVTWRTASEVDTAGFNVWRFANGKKVKVNRSLIAAKAGGRAAGATYRLVDRNALPGAKYTYRLQVVSKSGVRAFKASTTVRALR